MKNLSKQSSQSGVFAISPDQKANGTVTLAGRSTSLYVWSEVPLDISSSRTITGILDDLTKVSLIGCRIRSQGHTGKEGQIHYKCLFSPQCVIFGSRYFSSNENDVRQVSFTLEHAVALFNDTDAYGTIFNNPEAVERLAQIENPGRSISVEDWNWASYYTGKKTVFFSDTTIGRVSADHSPVFSVGVASNSGLTKKTYINIKFAEPLTVLESLNRMGRVLQFIDLMVGHSQGVSEINIHTGFDHPSHIADVYSPSYAEYPTSQERDEPGFHTILIDPVHNADSFASVLRVWLERDLKWRAARMRLSRVWGESVYNYDRIIAAANVFDLLPGEVYGSNTALPEDLVDTIQEVRNIFRRLPESDERNDMLRYLGRIGDWRLRRKIRHRAKSITNTIGNLVPEIDIVIKEAVILRNFYVHGTPSRLDSDRQLELLSFLCNSLEFIFFASDLVDVGWDISDWCRKPKPLGHPFHDYLASYQENLSKLKTALE